MHHIHGYILYKLFFYSIDTNIKCVGTELLNTILYLQLLLHYSRTLIFIAL